MDLESAPQPKKPDLRLVQRPETVHEDIPRLSSEQLDEICSMNVPSRELHHFEDAVTHGSETFGPLLGALVARNIKDELPVEEPTFTYKRNVQECEQLKKSVLALQGIDLRKDGKKARSLLQDASKLLFLELKKAEWLEQEFYPEVFGKAIITARAEVNQFLIRQKNTKDLEGFRDARLPEIHMQDDLNYLLKGNPPGAVGVYRHGRIDMRIPEYFTDKDEWRVYLVAVHELLHSVSHQSYEGVGMDKRGIDPDLEALNEAVTQLLTYRIALEHLDQEKTPLQQQRHRRLSLTDMPYSEYTLIVRQVFSKIPMDYFTDAMLNGSGWEKLRLKFKEVFGSEDAVISYARNLRNAYLPPEKRKKGGEVIPLERGKRKAKKPVRSLEGSEEEE